MGTGLSPNEKPNKRPPISPKKANHTATQALRATHTPRDALYDLGPERRAHETIWPPEAYAEMNRAMAAIPLHWRAFLKAALFDAMGSTPTADPVDKLRTALANLAAQHPALGKVMQD